MASNSPRTSSAHNLHASESVAIIARNLAEHISTLSTEIIDSFSLDSREERVLKLRDITGRIIFNELAPVSLWLERNRPPDKVDMFRRRIHFICDEAIVCVGLDIPEYSGGLIKQAKEGYCHSQEQVRFAKFSISALAAVDYILGWATEIEAESSLQVTHSSEPILPQVEFKTEMGTAEITWNGKTYAEVNWDAAKLLDAVVKGHPRPVGLTKLAGDKPKRILPKLGKDLQALMQSSPQGYTLNL
ncbi:hypothetical protein [Bythopirellula goksoeyrii]|uniref:Uncharacterized protein n=1 Tax=Bythopirellula goksoeyrii TaxID=1400387 RepID=A0A5B9Q9M3_9BACT|nr:hypothetical protein [Bythopirellula goksoeyrii]QEG34439.1 hypothetical protein Pr1d_17180 [Bythopirellula goksoeyrii]